MAQQPMKIYYVFILFYLLNSIFGGSYQRRLLQDLFAEKQHDKLERASIDNSVAVSIDIGFNLLQIMDFDEKNQVLTTNGILTLIWDDNRMMWEPADYGINTTMSNTEIELTSYVKNFKWDLKDTSAMINLVQFDCCPEVFESAVFTIQIARHSLDSFGNVTDTKTKNNQRNDIQK
ncbi:unnamed protein product [Rotaria sordida]|uniref:Neurotransmitter-gated ion-channel ligand-binding domain-containing protein n=1 Tax=Rotaria sordida TaxID=392033 RepID=A0A815FL30_9BILA|nr:unnamed protein product [Rotaria sordida]CAF1356305.1 unnamed protein product [Rotaria sordida]